MSSNSENELKLISTKMVIPIDQATSQNLLNTSILPFYRTLNDTAHRLTRQPNVTADLPQIGFNLYLASLTDMREGFGVR